MKKILLIEDNATIRENTAEILSLANYQVFTAENGKLGVELALKEHPDLIICDVMMPVLDGYGVLHLLHQNSALRNTPFIFLTAKTERADLRKGMELGADDYISKPFEETELLNAVESRLKKVESLKQELSQQGSRPGDPQADREFLKTFTENRNINRYKKKQIIYSEGNRPSRLYYLTKGKVKTYKTNGEGKELVIDIHKEGDFLGYVALLEGMPYKETAEAIENAELAIIPREEFEELINSNREAVKKFLDMMAQNIGEKEDHLLGLAYNSLRMKVANCLLLLHKKYGGAINISRENMAALAGTATESLVRTLSDFKNEKLIDLQEAGIVILNEKKLLDMVS
ncbi:MAG TPA: response regulator [Puia sp.]|nr:response regulator [Puia sp.]